MNKSINPVKQAIKTYLDNRAKTDELFAVAYANPNKNIDECFNYILGEAQKEYFRTRDINVLRRSKALEKRVDTILAEYDNPQKDLFEEGCNQ